MDMQHRRLLNRKRLVLLDGLKLDSVLPVLEEKRILEESECRQLREMSENSRQQNSSFLEMLKRSGSNAFPAFLDALRLEQPSIAKLLSVEPGEDEAWSNPSSLGSSRQVSREGSLDQESRIRAVAQHMEAIEHDNLELSTSPTAFPISPESPPKDVAHIHDLQERFRDRPVSTLSADTRASFCRLLDRKHPFGDDWRRLYILLGLPEEKLSLLEKSWMTSTEEQSQDNEGPTEQTLFVWQGRIGVSAATVAMLIKALMAMQRRDAIDVLASI
ncbi:uncharacterized protein LOC135823914 [Sycon ciliatum]|uniref:uncharacterized protein LOC135823914 n=1 Tax=Sycon ciliatum TaxID=27933 RepID=UPI0020ADEE67|eukprot:scpid69873/ scgid28165/ 